MKITNYDQVVEQLLPKLEDYLQENGYDTNRNFTCINPAHTDKVPSCSIQGDNAKRTFHCMACGAAGNVFHAAHFLDELPITGRAFITDNLLVLAKRYNVQVDIGELSDEEIYEIDTYRAYRSASSLISYTGRAAKYAAERGLSESTCRAYGVGGVESYGRFREQLKRLGYGAGFLDEIDLGRKDIFNENSLIFTIHDESGRPVGFAARNLDYETDHESKKYVNQKTTGLKCNIYQKGRRLYGLHKCDPTKPLYIFEGYIDVLTCHQNGIDNTSGLGGTALTKDHIVTLRDAGYYDVILCLDGDKPGQDRTEDILDNRFADVRDIKLRVIELPVPAGRDKTDPDEFVRTNGRDAFTKLRKWSDFEWRLNRISDTQDPEEICDQMIPYIVRETNYVRQEAMAKTLFEHTGYSLQAILSEVRRRQNVKEEDRAQARGAVVDKMLRDLRHSPDDAEAILLQAQGQIRNLNKLYNADAYSFDSCIEFVRSQMESEESKSDEYGGFLLGSDLENLQTILPGPWKQDALLLWGGKANVGKSSILSKIAWEICNIPENDCISVYWSIDDTRELLLPKFICVAEGSRQLEINGVINPNYYSRSNPDLVQRRKAGYNRVLESMRNQNLMIKDMNDGSDLAYMESLISGLRDRYPSKRIFFVLDNFHKLQDFASLEERIRFKHLSQMVKGLATNYHITIAATVEYPKLMRGQRPSDDNIGESAQLAYDANFTMHLFNELHELGPAAEHFHLDPMSGNKLPRIEGIVGKNKLGAFKSSVFFDFFPSSSDFIGIDPLLVESQQPQQKKSKVSMI